MNDIRPDDHGLSTSMQHDRWYRDLRYVPRDRSIADKVRESPVTFFLSLAGLCACLILAVLIPACGGL